MLLNAVSRILQKILSEDEYRAREREICKYAAHEYFSLGNFFTQILSLYIVNDKINVRWKT